MAAITGQAQKVASVAHGTLLPVRRLQVLAAFQTIWRWRHSHREDSRKLTEYAVAATHSHSRLRVVYDALRGLDHWMDESASAAAIVLRATTEVTQAKPQPEPLPSTRGGSAVFFFDGGSRGNLGPGGSGAVIVRVG